MMYFLLCRELPFEDLDQIETGKFTFDSPVWNYVSEEAKNLIKNILLVNTKKRIKLNQALDHPWFQVMNKQKQNNEKPKNLPVPHRSYSQLVEKLVQFRMENQFRREVLMIMVKRMSPNENIRIFLETQIKIKMVQLQQMNQDFVCMNLDTKIFKTQTNYSKKYVEQINKRTYLQNKVEFIAATLDESTYLNRTKLQQIFQYLNSTETGYITSEDIKDVNIIIILLQNQPHMLKSNEYIFKTLKQYQ